LSATQLGLNLEQAQKLLDHVADRLHAADPASAERLLDEFVDRLRRLDDIANIKQSIASADHAALRKLGGIDDAKALVRLIERFAQGE
jgi:hypothetical protein